MNLNFIIVYVEDFPKMKAFYEKALGMTNMGSQMIANERKRGWWLTGWLILLTFSYACETLACLANDPTLSSTERAALPFLAVAAIIAIGAVIALWFWRKVGFYLLVVTAAPLIILNLIFGVQLLTALFPLYSLSTTWILLQPRWQYFY